MKTWDVIIDTIHRVGEENTFMFSGTLLEWSGSNSGSEKISFSFTTILNVDKEDVHVDRKIRDLVTPYATTKQVDRIYKLSHERCFDHDDDITPLRSLEYIRSRYKGKAGEAINYMKGMIEHHKAKEEEQKEVDIPDYPEDSNHF